MIRMLFLHIVSGILGLFLAVKFVPKVEFFGSWGMLLIIGSILGIINFFIKPVLKVVSLPLRILTLGLFNLVINMGLIWLVEILFPEDLEITGLLPLFWTTVIIWALNLILGLYNSKKMKSL